MKFLTSALVTLLMIGCGADPAPKELKEPEPETVVTTEIAEVQPNQKVLQVHGTLVVPPSHEATVHPMFAGYVHSIELLPGEKVKKGEVLFELTHPNYLERQRNYLSAQALFKQQEKEWKRQSQLYAEKISSDKEAAEAENLWSQAKASYWAAQAEVKLMGIDVPALEKGVIRPTLYVRAPIDGYVTEVGAHQGMYLSENQAAVTITDLTQMHLELEVFEHQASQLATGQSVSFYLQDRPEQVYSAQIHVINKAINPQTRTLVVHADIDQTVQGTLTPGMFVVAQIAID